MLDCSFLAGIRKYLIKSSSVQRYLISYAIFIFSECRGGRDPTPFRPPGRHAVTTGSQTGKPQACEMSILWNEKRHVLYPYSFLLSITIMRFRACDITLISYNHVVVEMYSTYCPVLLGAPITAALPICFCWHESSQILSLTR